MRSIAGGEGAPIDITLLDLVDICKAFAQISTTNNKKTAKPEKYSLKRALRSMVRRVMQQYNQKCLKFMIEVFLNLKTLRS